MNSTITVDRIRISGFRAYLKEQVITLRRDTTPLSLAVLAPNAKGKSSLVDAIEFFFSDDGTLKRLGKIKSDTQAGREALVHVDAAKAGIPPQVELSFFSGDQTFGASRIVEAGGGAKPEPAARVLSQRRVNPIIHGYELRGFVENQSAQERYEEMAEWFSLSSLTRIQENLRALRLRLKSCVEDFDEFTEHLRQLKELSSGAVVDLDEGKMLNWVNRTLLQPLDPVLSMGSLARDDSGYATCVQRKQSEEQQLGSASLRRILETVQKVFLLETDKDGSQRYFGTLAEYESSVGDLATAQDKERAERAKSEKAVFKAVWDAALPLLGNRDMALERCPVCDTPFKQTPFGAREKLCIHLEAELSSIRDYASAQEAVRKAQGIADNKLQVLRESLSNVAATLTALGLKAQGESYSSRLREIPDEVSATSITFVRTLSDELSQLGEWAVKEAERMEIEQGGKTYGNAVATIERILEIDSHIRKSHRRLSELRDLYERVCDVVSSTDSEIRDSVQAVVDSLAGSVNLIYSAMQMSDGKACIRLELPPVEQRDQQRLRLLLNFVEDRQGVAPGGYLSDSQIHMLALSLRLAAIKQLNQNVPVIILDDVVSSFDADHRKAIASMLEKYFADFQLLVFTHDERFFTFLKEHLPAAKWEFKRIGEIEKGFGPKFLDHMVRDATIASKLDRGESAANEIRQAEEEWLMRICREFGVDQFRMRSTQRPYHYDRAELASALQSFLKNAKLAVPKIDGISNAFAVSLQQGEVENFGSHFQDTSAAQGSIGDEKKRWAEFEEFRRLFVCPNCGSDRFTRPHDILLPLCKKCISPFSFKPPQVRSG